jgi:hypothetical protein
MKYKILTLLNVLSASLLSLPETSQASDIVTFYFSKTSKTAVEALGALSADSNYIDQQYQMNGGAVDTTFTDLNTGSSATASLRNDGLKTNGYADSPALLHDYASSSKTFVDSSKITFTGLAKNTTYTIYIYSQGFNDATHNFITNVDVNATGSFTRLGTLTTTDLNSYVINQNYLVDTVNTGADGKLVVSFYTNTASNSYNRGAINAVQLVYGGLSVVPEPTSVALLGIGGALFALRSKKESHG